ncbi:coiled-coil domain-containing protein [Vibrio splendidus]
MKNKAITCFFSTLPYSGTAEKQAKLKKSAGHSIRDENAKSETIEWNPDLSHLNEVYINNQWTKLDELSNDDKSQFIESIRLPQKPQEGLTKCKQRKRAYKKKLKAALQSEKGNPEGTNFIAKILGTPEHVPLKLDSLLNEARSIDFSRKKQRLNAFEKYISLHNKLVSFPKNLNSNLVEESIFVIPHRNEVSQDLVCGREMAEALMDYYRLYFKEYEIISVFVHSDERSLNEDTGEHVHLFLNAQNSRTKEWDLRVAKANLAQMMKNFLDHSHSPIQYRKGACFTRREQSEHGALLQECFRRFMNKNLFIEKGLSMEFNQELQKDKQKVKEMRRQGKQKKSERDYNYHTRMLENEQLQIEQIIALKLEELSQLNQHINEVKNKQKEEQEKIRRLHVDIDLLRSATNTATNQLDTTLTDLSTVKEQLKTAESKALHSEEKNEQLEKSISYLKKVIAKLTHTVIETLAPIFQDLMKSFVFEQRDEKELLTLLERRMSAHMTKLDGNPIQQALVCGVKDALLDNRENLNTASPKKRRMSADREFD